MTTPQLIMTISATSGVVALIFLIVNFFSFASDRTRLGLAMGLHVFFGAWASLSWLSFIVGLVMFLIDYAKS